MHDKAVVRVRIGYSLLTFFVAVVLATFFVVPPGGAKVLGDSFVGPATWPRAMLIGLAFCAGVLVFQNVTLYASAQRESTPAGHLTDEFDSRKAVIGIALLTLYIVALPIVGFAVATLAFFLVWLPYGGVRKPYVVASVAIVGTIALLYMFVKLTTLPLERGIGAFDSLTVSLYRVLGIY